MVKHRNLTQNFNFATKMKILVRDRNFSRKSKYSSKIKIFGKKSKFWSKITGLIRKFGKLKIIKKTEIRKNSVKRKK